MDNDRRGSPQEIPNTELARGIYRELQGMHERKIEIYSPGHGRYPSANNGILDVKFPDYGDEITTEFYLRRGFSPEQIARGLFSLSGENGSDKQLALSPEGSIFAVEATRPGMFREYQATEADLDAIEAIATLSDVPRRILDHFGDFKAFTQALDSRGSLEGLLGYAVFRRRLEHELTALAANREGQLMESHGRNIKVTDDSIHETDYHRSYYQEVLKQVTSAKETLQ